MKNKREKKQNQKLALWKDQQMEKSLARLKKDRISNCQN